MRMGRGGAVCLPFHLRWLLPWAVGGNTVGWRVVSWFSLAAIPLLTFSYVANRVGWQAGALAGILTALLPQMRFMFRAPVLVDANAMMLTLLSITLPWPYGLPVLVCAAATKETTPIWAAVYAWDWWPLLGLVVPLIRYIFWKAGDDVALMDDESRAAVQYPFLSSLRWHRGQWLSARAMLLPWGVLLVAPLHMNLQLVVALGLAYGLLLVVTDTARIYWWAAPVMCLVAAPHLLPFAFLAIVLHAFNPWAGNGI